MITTSNAGIRRAGGGEQAAMTEEGDGPDGAGEDGDTSRGGGAGGAGQGSGSGTPSDGGAGEGGATAVRIAVITGVFTVAAAAITAIATLFAGAGSGDTAAKETSETSDPPPAPSGESQGWGWPVRRELLPNAVSNAEVDDLFGWQSEGDDFAVVDDTDHFRVYNGAGLLMETSTREMPSRSSCQEIVDGGDYQEGRSETDEESVQGTLEVGEYVCLITSREHLVLVRRSAPGLFDFYPTLGDE
ncbi:hypothetical protein [Streptomyces hoynatensis]|nr:hypothetical protein [Streptomyces hoynatensis]